MHILYIAGRSLLALKFSKVHALFYMLYAGTLYWLFSMRVRCTDFFFLQILSTLYWHFCKILPERHRAEGPASAPRVYFRLFLLALLPALMSGIGLKGQFLHLENIFVFVFNFLCDVLPERHRAEGAVSAPRCSSCWSALETPSPSFNAPCPQRLYIAAKETQYIRERDLETPSPSLNAPCHRGWQR